MHDATVMSASATQAAPLPAPRARTIVLLVVAVGSSSMLTGWVGTEDEETVTGQLRAPTVEVRIANGSRVASWLIKDGGRVAEDADLATLVDPDAKHRIERQRRVVANLETDLHRREASAAVDLSWRIRTIEAEILANRLKAADLIQRHYDQKIELHAWRDQLRSRKPRVASSKSPDEVFQTAAYNSGIVSNRRLISIRQFEAARNSTEVTKVQLQLCEDRLKELEKLKEMLPANVRLAAGVDESKAKLKIAKAELKKLEENKGNRTIRAPAWGTLRLESAASSAESNNQPARIVDDEHRFLVVTVPSRLLGRFQLGQTVKVRFNNHVEHSGIVERIKDPTAGSTDVTMIVRPKGRLWPGVPLGSAAHVVVPKDE